MKRTPLKRVSTKRSKELKEYAKLRKAYLEAHPYCEVYLAENGLKYEGKPIDAPLATDIHHRRGRWLQAHQRLSHRARKSGNRTNERTRMIIILSLIAAASISLLVDAFSDWA
jgi:hypothetical protein